MSYNSGDSSVSLPLESATLQGRMRQLGFWTFLASETVLFASLIGTYLSLRGQTGDGPTPQDVFHLPLIFFGTFVLLTSSLTSVLSTVGMHRRNFKMMHGWLAATIFLGWVFMIFQVYEFWDYHQAGLTFGVSAFGSAFYALVGFHGAHVFLGLFWLMTLQFQSLNNHLFTRKPWLTTQNASKLYIAGLYWHFIDVVWVIIFTVVYLLGKVG